MKTAICGNWHFWESGGKILASNEVLKRLYSFDNFDNVCNWLAVHNLGIAKQFYKAWKAQAWKPKIQKVVFRVFPKRDGGEVIALFCNSAQDCNPGMVMSYMHIGQHGEASKSLGRRLRLASPAEYAPLLAEIQRIYAPEYKIVPVSRLIP